MNLELAYSQLVKFINDPLTPLIQAAHGNTVYLYTGLTILLFLEAGSLWFAWLPGPTTVFIASSIVANSSDQLNIWLLLSLFVLAEFMGWEYKYFKGDRHASRAKNDGKLKGSFSFAENYFVCHKRPSLLLGRFIPVIDLFVPIIAGQSKMNVGNFTRLNFIGALIWITVYGLSGYYLGKIPFVAQHFSIVILVILVLPTVIHYLHKLLSKEVGCFKRRMK